MGSDWFLILKWDKTDRELHTYVPTKPAVEIYVFVSGVTPTIEKQYHLPSMQVALPFSPIH